MTRLDLGEGGARLQHAGRFALGAICFLQLPGPDGEFLLKARVVHSAVSRTAPGPGEETILFYQTGVEFVGLTAEVLAALRQVLASLNEAGPPA